MSLQHAAKHLEKHGRNGDTMLVHMSPGEVKSLNDLAMAHGGHLTINPHTGLAEAGFLSRLLPMVAGAALTATGVGAGMAALMVGGGYAAATGSLKKGLMAGLGAYGGAGLGTSLAQAGASSVAPEVAPEVAQGTVASAIPAPVQIVDASNYVKPAPYVEAPPAASISAAAPVNMTAPVSAPVGSSPVITNALPPVNATPTHVTSMAGMNYAPSVNPIPAPAPVAVSETAPRMVDYESTGTAPSLRASVDVSRPSSYSLSNQTGNYNLVRPTATVPTSVEPDYSRYLGGSAQTGANASAAAPLSLENMTTAQRLEAMKQGATFDNLTNWAKQNPMQAYSMGASLLMPEEKAKPKPKVDSDPGQQYTYEANATSPTPTADPYGTERKYYNQRYVARAGGGPVEAMSNANAVGANTGYPMADINKPVYASPFQTPVSNNVVHGTSDTGVNPMTGEIANFARGGLSDAQYNLGSYSDGGRLLRGPGDGVSDSIPAVIGKKQPARLADGEFVVPARIVSELGNGSTEAGARKLYAMMDRIQKARGKTVGKGKVAKNSRAEKYLPA